MRTRRGECYPKAMDVCVKRTRKCESSSLAGRKKTKISPENTIPARRDFFDGLPDDIVLYILCKLSATADCPADFINALITCKRFNGLGFHPLVLSRAGEGTVAVRAKNWSESAHKFLKLCADTGNVEACFILGMIRFYCLQNRSSGASLMARAAVGNHTSALYSLAVVQFNGSGGSKTDKNLRAGVALCARSAFLGHMDALRELGHCLQDGYGVRRNIVEGRRLLIQANARELAHVLVAHPTAVVPRSWLSDNPDCQPPGGCPLLSDFGCNLPAPEPHAANRFLSEWYSGRVGSNPGLRMCSHLSCGRVETRCHEFRRCSVCGAVNYCSRACQALDWKRRHKRECAPLMERWGDVDGGQIVDYGEGEHQINLNGDGVENGGDNGGVNGNDEVMDEFENDGDFGVENENM